MNKNHLRLILALILLGSFAAFLAFGGRQYFSLDFLKANQAKILNFYAENFWTTLTWFCLIYVVSAALSFPGATALSLTGGLIFGNFLGSVLVLVSATIGASLAFLSARFLLRDFVQNRFASQLTKINDGVKKEGVYYLFLLRLAPTFPFFMVNLLMGLTPMKLVAN